MINFDEFDIEERTSSIRYKIIEYIYKFPYNDEYSYNGYRFLLYNEHGYLYHGNGSWGKHGFRQYKISNDEKQLIIENKIFITNNRVSNSTDFMSWILDDLISELKVYDQKFLDYVSTH